jgi:predicted dehydrogenase
VTAICFVYRYAPGTQVARREVQAGRIGRLLDIQMEWRYKASPRQVIEIMPWCTQVRTGLLGAGGSHEFDRVRFLTACEFSSVVGRVVPLTLSQEPGYTSHCGSFALLAELTDGVLGQFRQTLTAGQRGYRLVIHGEQGTLDVTQEKATRQSVGEDEAVPLEIPAADRVPEDISRLQHLWNRLIADFCIAVRRGDVAHATVPNLPKLVDGLRAQEVIDAAMRSEAERRWVKVGEED